MRIRRIIITKECNIANIAELRKQPCVRKWWKLPLDYAIFEFYHPIFERIYDDDLDMSNAARMEEQVRLETAAALSEERRLLAPLYQEIKNPSDALTLLVPSKTAIYHFLGKGKGQIPWPNLACSNGWELSSRIHIRGRLVAAIPETLKSLQTVISDWANSMKYVGAITEMDDISFTGESFAFAAECSEHCGDAAMALFVLLTETRQMTSVQAVQFTPAEAAN